MGFKNNYVDCRIERYQKGKNIWAKLLDDLEYTSEAGVTYKVPKGFETDFASVPKIIWFLFPPFGKYTQAAVLHDWFYSGNGVESREEADDLFYEAGLSSAMQKISMWIMWFFVRLYAWFAYTSPSGTKGKLDKAGIAGIVVAVVAVIAIVVPIVIKAMQ